MSALRVICPEWPPLDTAAPAWDSRGPAGDIAYALDSYQVQSATPIPGPAKPFGVSDIAKIVRQSVTYGGQPYDIAQGNYGTELQMAVIGVLLDGRWFAVCAWNDYTGWGCQDHADIRVGASEEQVVRYGLGDEERSLLGYPKATAAEAFGGGQ